MKMMTLKRNGWRMLLAGALLLAGSAVAAEPSLKHAVVCPPFKGDAELAQLYHDAMVELLQESDGVEYLDGVRALARQAPRYTYRILGTVEPGKNGESFITVRVMDHARKEQIVSHMSQASSDPDDVKKWKKTIQKAIVRKTSRQPFECGAIRRRRGQASLSLDRGLDSGLQPGTVLELAWEDEDLISPDTGEVVGRDSPKAIGEIKVFRVMANTAYARPVEGTRIPSTKRLYARTF